MGINTFQESEVYKALMTGNVPQVSSLVAGGRQKHLFRLLSSTGETYLHLAVQQNCDLSIIKLLVSQVRLGQRNSDCQTALELALAKGNPGSVLIAKIHEEYILDCIRDGKVKVLQELVMDGWSYWPTRGMPEIEKFSEAPMYLSQSIAGVSLTEVLYVFTKKRLKELVELSVKQKKSAHIAKETDAMGLTLLHKAVLFKDVGSVKVLLEHTDARTLLSIQDNMGRTPIHYSSCLSKYNDIRHLLSETLQSLSLEGINDISDKTGHTPDDYIHNKAKIDIKKVLNLAIALCKARDLAKLFTEVTIQESPFDPEKDSQISLLSTNCDGTALLDVTGRNILHKLVIFGDELDYARGIMSVDKDNVLFTGQDLWGRTPMHYAYMLNHSKAIQAFNTKKGYITLDLINTVKQLKDHEGKTIHDYHLEEEDAESLAKNLQESIILLYKARSAMIIQQKLLKSVLSTPYADDPVEDSEFYLSREKEVLEKLCTGNGCGDELIFGMKDFSGSTMAHYAVRLNHQGLQRMLMEADGAEDWFLKIHDNFGRNPLHYISCLPEGSEFRDWAASIKTEDTQDQGDKNAASDAKMENTDEEESTARKSKVKTNKTMKSVDNAMELDHLKEEEFLKFLRSGLEQLKVGLQVKETFGPKDDSMVKPQTGGSMVNSKSTPSLKNARFSAIQSKPQGSEEEDIVTPFDSEYLKKEIGVTLIGGLSDISLIHPADPIEYLAQYLYKHADNRKRKEQEKKEMDQLKLDEERSEIETKRREVLNMERRELQKRQNQVHEGGNRADVIMEEDEV